jgi:hypothetical protein
MKLRHAYCCEICLCRMRKSMNDFKIVGTISNLVRYPGRDSKEEPAKNKLELLPLCQI